MSLAGSFPAKTQGGWPIALDQPPACCGPEPITSRSQPLRICAGRLRHHMPASPPASYSSRPALRPIKSGVGGGVGGGWAGVGGLLVQPAFALLLQLMAGVPARRRHLPLVAPPLNVHRAAPHEKARRPGFAAPRRERSRKFWPARWPKSMRGRWACAFRGVGGGLGAARTGVTCWRACAWAASRPWKFVRCSPRGGMSAMSRRTNCAADSTFASHPRST